MGYAWRWLSQRSDTSSFFGSIAISAFVLTQILDGILTYRGVRIWGIDTEANLLLSLAMSAAGFIPGLIAAKLVAAGLGVLIYRGGYLNLVAALTAIYWFLAIIPWIYLFLIF